jgi:hypothetical protein
LYLRKEEIGGEAGEEEDVEEEQPRRAYASRASRVPEHSKRGEKEASWPISSAMEEFVVDGALSRSSPWR